MGFGLTSKSINLLGNKSYSGNVALKIDITKPFDTLNWIFLIKNLSAVGFNHKFFYWILTPQFCQSFYMLKWCAGGLFRLLQWC